MADWDVTWEPKNRQGFGPNFDTQVSNFRSGKKQYRQMLDSVRRIFPLFFDGVSEAAFIFQIMTFFNARKGQAESFTFPNYTQIIDGTRLAIVDSSPDTITDSLSQFVLWGYETGGKITIAGSGAGNDGVYDIHASTAVTAGTVTVAAAESLSAESANADLKVYMTYDVRFAVDNLMSLFLKKDKGVYRTIELIEDI